MQAVTFVISDCQFRLHQRQRSSTGRFAAREIRHDLEPPQTRDEAATLPKLVRCCLRSTYSDRRPKFLDTRTSGDNSPRIARSRESCELDAWEWSGKSFNPIATALGALSVQTNRVWRGLMGEFSDACPLTPAGFVGAIEFYPSAACRWAAAAASGVPPRPKAGSWSVDFR